eukprot:471698-Pyramimonas_sp.AAC.1
MTYEGRPWMIFDKMYNRFKLSLVTESFGDITRESWAKKRKLDGGGAGPSGQAASGIGGGPAAAEQGATIAGEEPDARQKKSPAE